MGHVGVGGSCRGRLGHAGVGWVMLGCGVLCRVGGSCRDGVGSHLSD